MNLGALGEGSIHTSLGFVWKKQTMMDQAQTIWSPFGELPIVKIQSEYCEMLSQHIITKHHLSLQDFCHGQVMWPPLSALQVKIAEPGKSCKQVCQESQLICEPSFFQHLNKDKALLR